MSNSRNLADLASNDVIDTSATGVDITGTVTADGLSTTGNSYVGAGNYFTDNTSGYFFSGNGNYDAGVFATGTTLTTLRAQSNIDLVTSSARRIRVASGGDVDFYEDTGTDVKMKWDASQEKLRIGTNVNGGDLQLKHQSYIGFSNSADNSNDKYIYANGGNLEFGTQAQTRLTIDTNGLVGIGTTTPESKLHVDGDNTWIRHTSHNSYMDMGCWVSGEGRIETDNDILNLRSSSNIRIELGSNLRHRFSANTIEMFSTEDLTTNAGVLYTSFKSSDGAEKAWMGYGSETDTNFRINNNNGGKLLIRNGGNSAITTQPTGQVSINSESYYPWANLYVNGNLAVEDILYIPQAGKIQALAAFPGSVGSLSINPDGGNVNLLGATGRALDGTSGLSIRSSAPAIGFETTSGANDQLIYLGTGSGVNGLKFWNATVNYDQVVFSDLGDKWFMQPGIGNGSVFFDVNGSPANRARTSIQVNTDYTRIQAYGIGSSKGDLALQPLGNRVAVGTTTTRNNAKLTVKGGIAYSTNPEGGLNGVDPRSILGWYTWAESGNNNRSYIHLKTNLWGGAGSNYDYTMSLFEVKGYRYSPGAVGRGLIGFHNWSNALPGLAVSNDTSWNIAQNPYISTDGFVVLVIYIGGSYGGFTLDWHQFYPYPFRDKEVANIAYSTSATGVF